MIQRILDKSVAGERLTPDEGLALLQSNDLAALGRAADAVTRRHPEPIRTYNIDRNINYTNVCARRSATSARSIANPRAPKATFCRVKSCWRRCVRQWSWGAIRS